PIGQRSCGIEVTPDGSKIVVANRDSDFVSIVDAATLTTTNVTAGTRGDQIEISPDGQFAYMAVVTNGDGVWRINLNTGAVVPPKLLTGDMGSVGFVGTQFSGMTLSHDGNTLVTCDSFHNAITIIDVPTWSIATTVLVGDFPVRATFSADDSTIYVTNRNSDDLDIVSNAGAASALLTTIPVANFPYFSVVSSDNTRL